MTFTARPAKCHHDAIPWISYLKLAGWDWQYRQCPQCHLVCRRVIK